jgi:hypothetical protein
MSLSLGGRWGARGAEGRPFLLSSSYLQWRGRVLSRKHEEVADGS